MLPERVKDRIADVMATHYGHLPSVNGAWLASLFEEFAATDPAVLEEAVHRHLTNTALNTAGQPLGDRPPTMAQLVIHIRAVETERRQSADQIQKAHHQEQEKHAVWTWLELPAALQNKFPVCDETGKPVPGKFRRRIRVRKTDCPHCGDTGRARYYCDRRHKGRVFLATEFIQLPAALQRTLSCQTALCDCSRGRERTERIETAGTRPHGQERAVSVWPQLEAIRRLAARRPRQEAEIIGAQSNAQTTVTKNSVHPASRIAS